MSFFSFFRTMGFLLKFSVSRSLVFLSYRCHLRVTPLSPPEGEAARGEHPLDPPFFINHKGDVSMNERHGGITGV